MRKLTRLESAQRAELRELVPCMRRRQHLALVMQEAYRGEVTGALLQRYVVIAVTGPGEREALRPLVQRIASSSAARASAQLGLSPDNVGAGALAHLRLVEAEDGHLDGGALWSRGERVDDLLDPAPSFGCRS